MAKESPMQWYDRLHDNVTGTVNDTASWLDDFFADENFQIDDDPKGGARILLGWEPRTRDFAEFDTKVRLKFKLPNMKNQVDLVFSDFDEELERAPVKAAQNEVLANQNRFNLALRWTQKRDEDSVWSHRIGIGRKAQPFARSRYASRGELSKTQRYRWEISGYFYSSDGLGSHLGLQLEQDITRSSVARLDNNFFFRDESNDWLWQHNLYHMKQISDKSALISGVYLEGLSQPNYRIEEYLLSTRWRRNALRDWLYFEVEPFVLWKRDENFSASYGVALRVEGFFGHY